MAPFAFALRSADISSTRGKTFTGVGRDDQHNIQSHTIELSMLELAQQRQAYIAAEAESNRQSPDPQIQMYESGVEMTPPEESSSQMSVSTSSNNIINADAYYYDTKTTKQYELDERRKDVKIAMAQSPANTTNLNDKVVQMPHQQSSVFLSPTSDDSGLW